MDDCRYCLSPIPLRTPPGATTGRRQSERPWSWIASNPAATSLARCRSWPGPSGVLTRLTKSSTPSHSSGAQQVSAQTLDDVLRRQRLAKLYLCITDRRVAEEIGESDGSIRCGSTRRNRTRVCSGRKRAIGPSAAGQTTGCEKRSRPGRAGRRQPCGGYPVGCHRHRSRSGSRKVPGMPRRPASSFPAPAPAAPDKDRRRGGGSRNGGRPRRAPCR